MAVVADDNIFFIFMNGQSDEMLEEFMKEFNKLDLDAVKQGADIDCMIFENRAVLVPLKLSKSDIAKFYEVDVSVFDRIITSFMQNKEPEKNSHPRIPQQFRNIF